MERDGTLAVSTGCSLTAVAGASSPTSPSSARHGWAGERACHAACGGNDAIDVGGGEVVRLRDESALQVVQQARAGPPVPFVAIASPAPLHTTAEVTEVTGVTEVTQRLAARKAAKLAAAAAKE